MVLIYYSFFLIQTFFLLLYCALGFSLESSLSSKTPLSQNQPSPLLSLTKNSHRVFHKRTRTISFNRSSLNHLWRRMEFWKHWHNLEYRYPKFWFKRVFVMFEFISLSYELMIWWFWRIFYCSSPLSRFRFWVFASFLSVYLSLCSWSFLYFFYLINLIRVNKLIWFPFTHPNQEKQKNPNKQNNKKENRIVFLVWFPPTQISCLYTLLSFASSIIRSVIQYTIFLFLERIHL